MYLYKVKDQKMGLADIYSSFFSLENVVETAKNISERKRKEIFCNAIKKESSSDSYFMFLLNGVSKFIGL
jgi:hypothetical protein